MNDGSTNGNGKHKKKNRFNEGMPGSLLKNRLWDILLEMSYRKLVLVLRENCEQEM